METPFRFEPAFLEDDLPLALADLGVAIATESARLPGRLPPASALELAALVRIMNCYYSNLIEGHRTRPADIEKALLTPSKRPLLQEARAHVKVQERIDVMQSDGTLGQPTSIAFIKDVHRMFYEAMPLELRGFAKDGETIDVVPGAFRSANAENVAVGRHLPPSSPRVNDFMAEYEKRFAQADHGITRIIAIPAAHHRLKYIHPFVDGNGRVSRLVSHAMAHRAGIGCGGLWSISRGLARGLADPSEYKSMMDAADEVRRGSRDGRGNLSRAALVEFSHWFLRVALDQIRFCAQAFDLEGLGARYKANMPALFGSEHHDRLVREVLARGEVERGHAASILGTSERTARTVLSQCVDFGFLKSASPKGKVRVGFPLSEKGWLFPGLFVDETVSAMHRPLDLLSHRRSTHDIGD